MRRTVLAGLVGIATAATTVLVAASPASAADDYYLATTEQVSNGGDNAGSRTWGRPTVQFFDANGTATEAKTRSGAEFYKVRVYPTAFE